MYTYIKTFLQEHIDYNVCIDRRSTESIMGMYFIISHILECWYYHIW